MAGIEKITEKILADANTEAAQIIADAEAKASEIAKKGEAAADKKAAQIIAAAQAEAVEIKKRRQSVCDLELRKNILTAKRSVIELAYDKAYELVSNADKEEYQAIMLSMLVECAENGNGVIAVADADKDRIDKTLADKAVAELAAKGIERTIDVTDEKRAIKNGFVYITEGMEFNCSLESVLRQLRQDTETEVSKILFND